MSVANCVFDKSEKAGRLALDRVLPLLRATDYATKNPGLTAWALCSITK